jgi:hypothetical protein
MPGFQQFVQVVARWLGPTTSQWTTIQQIVTKNKKWKRCHGVAVELKKYYSNS